MRYEVRFQTIDSGKFVVCLEMSVHLLRTYTVRPPWGQKKWPLWEGRGDFLGSRTWRNMFIVAGSCLL